MTPRRSAVAVTDADLALLLTPDAVARPRPRSTAGPHDPWPAVLAISRPAEDTLVVLLATRTIAPPDGPGGTDGLPVLVREVTTWPSLQLGALNLVTRRAHEADTATALVASVNRDTLIRRSASTGTDL